MIVAYYAPCGSHKGRQPVCHMDQPLTDPPSTTLQHGTWRKIDGYVVIKRFEH
jgi:hypothetical protein